MRDVGEYLRAYWGYVASRGWGKALGIAVLWLAGIFVPLGARRFGQLPVADWMVITWMAGWGLCGYVFAPYGMWKRHRAEIASLSETDRK
jgi:hypothetical protein